ncbi:MAG TPA: hypothetical protein VGK19_20120 [Capsulimonadaceae bacterium]|jgi:hypothetical protein
MAGTAFVFRRKVSVPLGNGGSAGHVAWGFTVGDVIVCGGTENTGMHEWIPVGVDNGSWHREVKSIAEMEEVMREGNYEDYKSLKVLTPDPDAALRVVANNEVIGYSATGNNCLDHAYQVLIHYCALTLPIPTFNPIPNGWFSAIAGEYHRISPHREVPLTRNPETTRA